MPSKTISKRKTTEQPDGPAVDTKKSKLGANRTHSDGKRSRFDRFLAFASEKNDSAQQAVFSKLVENFMKHETDDYKAKLLAGQIDITDKKIGFGKYKGRTYLSLWQDRSDDPKADCGHSYLQWCANKDTMYPDVVTLINVLKELHP